MGKEKTFLEYANEAAGKIRKVNQLLCGTEVMEEGSMLDEIDTCIYRMLKIHLSPIVGAEADSDKLLDMATEIMYADESKIEELKKAGLC